MIAAAVVYIIGNLIIGVLTLEPAEAVSDTVQLIGWFPVLLITFVSSIYVLLKVPALRRSHIFSGTAGGSSAPLIEAVPATAAAAAKL